MLNNRRNSIVLIVAIGLVAIILFFLFSGKGSVTTANSANKPNIISDNWEESYEPESKAPLSLGFFYHELANHIIKPNNVVIVKNKKQWNNSILNDTNKTFLFIGYQFGVLGSEMDSLMLKVKNGADLIVFAENIKWQNQKELIGTFLPSYLYQKNISICSTKDTFNFSNVYQGDTLPRIWDLYKELESDSLDHLYSIRNYPIVVRKNYGKGTIIVSHSPYLLQNYHLIDKDGYKFAKDLLKHIDKNKSVNVMDIARSNEFGYEYYDDGTGERDESYWQFLLQNKSLLMGLILLFFGLFLFFLFRTKRTELITPYLPEKKNRSLSFIETVSSIYLQKNNPKAILQIQRKNFYNTVQKHFYIDLMKENTEQHLESLAHKTKIPLAEIKELIALIEETNYLLIDDEYIYKVSKKQRNFYLQSKVIKAEVDAAIWRKEIKVFRNVWIAGFVLLMGIFFILFGFGLLVNSRGIGVAFWPIGILTFYIGLLQLTKEIFLFNDKNIVFKPLLGKNKIINWTDLKAVENENNQIIVKSNHQDEIQIPKQLLNKTQLFLIQKMIEQYK